MHQRAEPCSSRPRRVRADGAMKQQTKPCSSRRSHVAAGSCTVCLRALACSSQLLLTAAARANTLGQQQTSGVSTYSSTRHDHETTGYAHCSLQRVLQRVLQLLHCSCGLAPRLRHCWRSLLLASAACTLLAANVRRLRNTALTRACSGGNHAAATAAAAAAGTNVLSGAWPSCR